MVARDGETHRGRGTCTLARTLLSVESIDRGRLSKINERDTLFTSPGLIHKTSLSPSESVKARQEMAEPGKRRWTGKIVRVCGGGSKAVTISLLVSSGFVPGRLRRNGKLTHSTYKGVQ